MTDHQILRLEGTIFVAEGRPCSLQVPLGFQEIDVFLAPGEKTTIKAHVNLQIRLLDGSADMTFFGIGSAEGVLFRLPLNQCRWAHIAIGESADPDKFVPPDHPSEELPDDLIHTLFPEEDK